MFRLFGTTGLDSVDESRMRRIEGKLDLILTHLGIPVPEDEGLSAEVKAMADEGNKIGAIKAYREITGVGLAEAKRAVEAYMAGRG